MEDRELIDKLVFINTYMDLNTDQYKLLETIAEEWFKEICADRRVCPRCCRDLVWGSVSAYYADAGMYKEKKRQVCPTTECQSSNTGDK